MSFSVDSTFAVNSAVQQELIFVSEHPKLSNVRVIDNIKAFKEKTFIYPDMH